MRYKGGRQYLHGSDIYNAVIPALDGLWGKGSYAGQLAFHRFARNQCDLFVAPAEQQAVVPEERVCDGIFHGGSGSWKIWLMETERPVEGRYTFDEDEICAASAIYDKSVSVTDALDYSPIEVAVALTKHLHNLLFPLEEQRWIFSKLEFSRLLEPEDTNRISIRLLLNLHNRITKSELRSGNELVGHIYFSAVTK
jgi:hypothetical protein